MARPARRHVRAGRSRAVHVIPARAQSGVLWKIYGCDGDAAWLPRRCRAVRRDRAVRPVRMDTPIIAAIVNFTRSLHGWCPERIGAPESQDGPRGWRMHISQFWASKMSRHVTRFAFT